MHFVMHSAALHNLNYTDASALVVWRDVWHWHWCGFRRTSSSIRLHQSFSNYSERKLLTGFIKDVLIDWKLIVVRVIDRIAVSGAINIHHSKFILKAKLSNHLVIVR